MDFIAQLEKWQQDANRQFNSLPEDVKNKVDFNLNKEINKAIKKINKAKNDFINKSK